MEDQISKEAFKKSIDVILKEISRYLTIHGQPYNPNGKYSGKDVGDMIKKQMNSDWNSFIQFIKNRMEDDVLNHIAKDYKDIFISDN